MMKQKDFNEWAGIIFSIVFVAHTLRVISGWSLIIGFYFVPMWVSLLAMLISGYMTVQAFSND